MKDIEEFAREEAQKNNANVVQQKTKIHKPVKTWWAWVLAAIMVLVFAAYIRGEWGNTDADGKEHSERKSNFALCYDLMYKSENCIEQYLKAPKTAEFPDITEWEIRGEEGVVMYLQSYVDALNPLGVPLRHDFIIKFEYVDGDYEPVALVLGDEVMFDYSSEGTEEDSP